MAYTKDELIEKVANAETPWEADGWEDEIRNLELEEEKRFVRRACPNCGHIVKYEFPQ